MTRKRIQRLERNYCVTAGAGAGKTQCMVDTYAGLLAGERRAPLTPEQIVAITFTEKAAGEMRSRVAATLAQRSRRQAGSGNPWARLRLALEWSPISTIHGFCSTLLKEFGVLLGLDPDFGVLDDLEYQTLLDEMIDDLLRQKLAQRDQDLAWLLTQYDLRRLAGILADLHQHLARAGVSITQAIQASEHAHLEPLGLVPELWDRFEQALGELEAARRAGEVPKSARYGARLDDLLQAWPDIKEQIAAQPLEVEVLDRLERLLKGNWGKLGELKDRARGPLESLVLRLPLSLAWELTRQVLGLLARVDEALERELSARAVLSFDHLLILARRLLWENHAVLARLRRRWRVIMVDEFQDVNPVQGDLVRLLAGLQDPPGYRPPEGEERPRLLVVGDPKQSIYAFRGAEVAEFTRTMENFPGGQVVSLPENFRSAPELVDFYNRTFPEVFAEGKHREVAPESYLEFREADRQKACSDSTALQGRPLEVLLVKGEGSLAQRREEEARVLAWYLERLIREEGVEAGEIVVLLRKLTQVAVYERALRQRGVDFYTVRGRGFFECQEVADMLMALKAVLDPEDEVALAGFLRSPLVGLSDEALLALAWEGREAGPRGLGRALERELPGWIDGQEHRRWQRARGLLAELRPLARRLLPAELLERILDDTGIIPVLAAAPGGEQKVANLRKLLEMARDPLEGGQGGAQEFVQELASLVENPPQDAQAPLVGENARVVRLMSIHQAKGLQFEVVVLADPGGRAGGWLGLPPPGPGGVVSFKPRDPAWGDLLDNMVHKQLRKRQQAREEAEDARLFYVACTRARRRLVFTLYQDGKYLATWAKWVQRMVNEGDFGLRSVDPPGDDTVCPPPGQAATVAMPAGPGPRDQGGARVVARCLERAPLAVARVRESVSGLESWFECPRLWFHTRRLGLDTGALWGPGRGEDDRAGGLSPVELGHAVHMLLELAPLQRGPQGLEEVRGLVGRRLGLEAEQVRAAAELAAGLWHTELGKRLAGLPPTHVLREQGFLLHLPAAKGVPEVEVLGSLDLVLVEESGPLVVDYKVTGLVQPEHYQDQLALYSLALWSGPGQGGPPPRTALCYLWSGGGRLVQLDFSPSELEGYRHRVQEAAAEMARLGPKTSILEVPARRDCTGCILESSAVCGR